MSNVNWKGVRQGLRKLAIEYIKISLSMVPITICGFIALHMGPAHSESIKMAIGFIIGGAIEHRRIFQSIKRLLAASDEIA